METLQELVARVLQRHNRPAPGQATSPISRIGTGRSSAEVVHGLLFDYLYPLR